MPSRIDEAGHTKAFGYPVIINVISQHGGSGGMYKE